MFYEGLRETTSSYEGALMNLESAPLSLHSIANHGYQTPVSDDQDLIIRTCNPTKTWGHKHIHEVTTLCKSVWVTT